MKNNNEVEIILIRHGETLWNVQGRWQGHSDSPLTETGITQAKAVARRLSDMRFSALYSSDLGRALDTADIISSATGHTITPDNRLRERNVGIFEGLTLAEMSERFPDSFAKYRENDPDFIMPGGESMKQRQALNISCFDELVEKHAGESIVVITHGGVLNGMFKHVLKIPPEASRRYKIINGAINAFVHGRNGWILQTWGDVSHYSFSDALDERY